MESSPQPYRVLRLYKWGKWSANSIQRRSSPATYAMLDLLPLLPPLRRPICLHAFGLLFARGGRHTTLAFLGWSRLGSHCGRGQSLARTAASFDWSLESFNRSIELIALCDE